MLAAQAKQQRQQRRLTYESREKSDSFRSSILSEISQTEHVKALNFEKEILKIVLVWFTFSRICRTWLLQVAGSVNNCKETLKGPFTKAIFVAATRCNFCRAQVRQVSNIFETPELNPCDIAATNRTENQTWFTRTILKLSL